MDFAMHDAEFTLYHEIGHLLVGEFGLPVLGKEEDAADALAVILMLTDEANPDESANALIDSANGWYFDAVKSTGSGVDDFAYYDEHSLDIQRAYAEVCMMVGAEPETFGETADSFDIDPEQQEACQGTYDQASQSWDVVLADAYATDKPGKKITVSHENAAKGSEQFEAELKKRQVLEKAATLISSRFNLPRDLKFVGMQCDEPNAWYDPESGQITYCYALTSDRYDLFINDILPSMTVGGVAPPPSRTAGSKGG